MQTQLKSQQDFFLDINKLILKFILKGKEMRIAETILKKDKVEELTVSHFKA